MDGLGTSALSGGRTLFVPGLCCTDGAGWEHPLGLVPAVGRRSRARASAVPGVLGKCLSKSLAGTGPLSAGGFLRLVLQDGRREICQFCTMVTGLASRVEGSCHSSGRHQIPMETSAHRLGRSPPPEAASQVGAGVGNPGNPALGRTQRLGPRDAAHCDS